MSRIKVAVRVRPLSDGEVRAGSASVVTVENDRTIAITNIKVPKRNAGDNRERIRRFTFDYCFKENSTQDELFEKIEDVINQSINRRCNSCVLAYGQSSSGKTHTMMGFPQDPGLTPKVCHRVFGYLHQAANSDETLKVSVSYLEIYNEKVKDLLRYEDAEYRDNTSIKKYNPLRIREHPNKGPYVQGLSEHAVNDVTGLLKWLDHGNKQRRVAATLTNPQSSRSHSVFSICCNGIKLHLIDLAGSERAGSRYYSTSQFREGANINKSLVALGTVISALAGQTCKQIKRRKFISYRDSILTWLLKDTLGGNSNTVMVVTISPSSMCYNETINALRFGQRAKLVTTHPVINEDLKEKTIRELKTEITILKSLLKLKQLPMQLFSMLTSYYDNGKLKKRNSNMENDIHNLSVQIDTTPSPVPDCNGAAVKLKHDLNFYIKEGNVNSGENLASANRRSSVTELLRKNYTHEQIISNSINNKCDADNDNCKLKGSVQNHTSKINIEKLIPLINVTSSLQPIKSTKLRRTYSVDHPYTKMGINMSKIFDSEESIPSLNGVYHQSSSSAILLRKQKSQEFVKKLNSVDNTSLVQHKNINKSIPSLTKLMSTKESFEKSKMKNGKSIVTEVLNNNKSVVTKVDSVPKNNIKPRSQIVAAVTSRLYSKIRKKEASANIDVNIFKNELSKPNEVTICSNTKARLKELTKKGLKVHRQKHKETQTDILPVLHLKDTSTDVDDLRIPPVEIRMQNAENNCDIIETRDASVGCTFLYNFSDNRRINHIMFTRTCGTQSCADLDEINIQRTNSNDNSLSTLNSEEPLRSSTQNLQEGWISILDVLNVVHTNVPIYTNTVNISPTCITGNKITDYISDNAEYKPSQNVCFPTPDLISNHNSLEQLNNENRKYSNVFKKIRNPIKYFGSMEILKDCFTSVDGYILIENIIYTIAEYLTVPKYTEKIHSITITNIQATEICLTKDFNYDLCMPLPIFEPNLAKPKVVKYNKFDYVKLEKPPVLKSMTGHCPSKSNSQFKFSHENFGKYDHLKKQDQPENQRIVQAMSKFLEEVSELVNNLTIAANNINCHDSLLTKSYELEVTLKSIKGLKQFNCKRRKTPAHQLKNSLSVSTKKVDCSTRCKFDYNFPENKYDTIVENSCIKLEKKVNRIPITQSIINLDSHSSCNDDVTSQLSECSINPWDTSHSLNNIGTENPSLESTQVAFSDYGSLPRNTYKRHRIPACSPSAFLKQLTNIRRQIIESSREEFSHCSNNY